MTKFTDFCSICIFVIVFFREGQSSIGGSLKMDQVSLTVDNRMSVDIMVYRQYDICWKCPLQNIATVRQMTNYSMVLSSQFPVHVALERSNISDGRQTICSFHRHLSQYGHYYMTVDGDNLTNASHVTCQLHLEDSPPDSNIPVYVMLAIFSGVTLLWILAQTIYRKYRRNLSTVPMPTEQLINSDLGAPTGLLPAESPIKVTVWKPRLRSLDTFRGISLVVMIFANYGGGGYWFFKHSTWNGITVADLVFPWFTFIMGTSIALALRARRRRDVPRRQVALEIVRRTAILFALGLLVSNTSCSRGLLDVGQMRIAGVLQRLAVTYCVVAFMELFARDTEQHQTKWWAVVRDVIAFAPQWLVSLGLLALHICLTFLLPVKDCPTGYLGPGGLHDNSSHWNCSGGAAGLIDRAVFGQQHLYQHPTFQKVYGGDVPFDPEGILGCITSVFICFLGLQAGRVITCYGGWMQRVKRWLIWAVITGLIAGILCNFSQNDGWIPCNKNLWSVSFVLALASMAFVLLSVCYVLADVYSIWSGTPFYQIGMNSILIYMCHEMFDQSFPVQFHVPNTHASQLSMNVWGCAFWVLVAWLMERKGFFISI